MPSPLLPTSPAPSSYRITSKVNTLKSESLSGRILTRKIGGQRFEATLVFPPMGQGAFNEIHAFLMERSANDIFYIQIPTFGDTHGVAGEYVNYSNHTKMYMVKSNGVDTYPDSLVTPTAPTAPTASGYDLSNSTSLNKTDNYNAQDSQAQGMSFNNDGTKWYMYGQEKGIVWEYTLATAYDVSTVTGYVDSPVLGTGFTDFKWKPDGTKLYLLDNYTTILELTVSTPWAVTTLVIPTTATPFTPTQGTQNIKFTFNDAGTMLFMLSIGSDAMFAYNLSTAWDVSTATYTGDALSLDTLLTTVDYLYGVEFSASGHKCFVTNYNPTPTSDRNAVFEIDLATSWDITTATYSGVNVQLPPTYGSAIGVLFNGDGSQVYVLDYHADQIVTFSSSVVSSGVVGSGVVSDVTYMRVSLKNDVQVIEYGADGTVRLEIDVMERI